VNLILIPHSVAGPHIPAGIDNAPIWVQWPSAMRDDPRDAVALLAGGHLWRFGASAFGPPDKPPSLLLLGSGYAESVKSRLGGTPQFIRSPEGFPASLMPFAVGMPTTDRWIVARATSWDDVRRLRRTGHERTAVVEIPVPGQAWSRAWLTREGQTLSARAPDFVPGLVRAADLLPALSEGRVASPIRPNVRALIEERDRLRALPLAWSIAVALLAAFAVVQLRTEQRSAALIHACRAAMLFPAAWCFGGRLATWGGGEALVIGSLAIWVAAVALAAGIRARWTGPEPAAEGILGVGLLLTGLPALSPWVGSLSPNAPAEGLAMAYAGVALGAVHAGRHRGAWLVRAALLVAVVAAAWGPWWTSTRLAGALAAGSLSAWLLSPALIASAAVLATLFLPITAFGGYGFFPDARIATLYDLRCVDLGVLVTRLSRSLFFLPLALVFVAFGLNSFAGHRLRQCVRGAPSVAFGAAVLMLCPLAGLPSLEGFEALLSGMGIVALAAGIAVGLGPPVERSGQ
jgi:hypothetical protein